MVEHRGTACTFRLFWMAGLLVSLACAADRADSLQESVATLECAIRAQPRSARNHFLLGAAAFELGDEAKALLHFETAATLDPAELLASYDAGLMRQLRGEYEEARRWFLQAAQANPQDWRTRARLAQVFEALRQPNERDQQRMALLAMHEAGKIDSPEFCREQFREGRYSVMVFERFELAGTWAMRYRFEVREGGENELARWITLGTYPETNALAALHGDIRVGERLFHLDEYGPGEHQTFAFYVGEPPYEETRARVVEVLRRQREPVSGSEADTSSLASLGAPPPAWRIENVRLGIDHNMTEEYIETTFQEIRQLAPFAVKDNRNHEIHIFRPWRPGHAGSELIAALVDSDKRVSIADITEGRKYSRARARIWRDATNGVGTDAYVYFHRDDPLIPTVQRNGRVIAQKGKQPPYICLGHELIHALHIVRGTLIGIPLDSGNLGTIEGKLTYLDGSGKQKTITQDEEELSTIGLGKYRDGLTENALRREHDLPLRGAHDFGKKK